MESRRIFATIVVALLVLSVLSAYWLGLSKIEPSRQQRSLSIEKVALDSVDSPPGTAIYIVFVDASNSGNDVWTIGPSSFDVRSNTSAYPETQPPFSGTTSSATLFKDQERLLQLSFQMPSDQTPSQLVYSGTGVSAMALPKASSWLSKFTDISDVTKSGEGGYVPGVIVYAVLLNTTYDSFSGDGRAVYRFFTGDHVTVGIEFEYYKRPVDPETIKIVALNNNDGFHILSVRPNPPVNMSGWGSRAEIEVTFLAPGESYASGLHFTAVFGNSSA